MQGLRLPVEGPPAREAAVHHVRTARRLPVPIVRAGRQQLVLLRRRNPEHERIQPHHQGERPRDHAEPDDRPQRLHALLGHHLRRAERQRLPGRTLQGQERRSPPRDGNRLHLQAQHVARPRRRTLRRRTAEVPRQVRTRGIDG